MRTSLFLLTLALIGCKASEISAPPNAGAGGNVSQTTGDVPAATQATDAEAHVGNGAVPANAAETPAQSQGACRMQAGNTVPENHLRAIGTEPFWGARIEGRCVTYSHPEDQAGTRIWTRFSGSSESGLWSGTHFGKAFVLRTRPQADCSDGMSDRRYPIAVSLTVGGEEREGCAERL